MAEIPSIYEGGAKMTRAQVCPVCEGRGIVPREFYPDLTETHCPAKYVVCRACNGTGIVWEPAVSSTKIEFPEIVVGSGERYRR